MVFYSLIIFLKNNKNFFYYLARAKKDAESQKHVKGRNFLRLKRFRETRFLQNVVQLVRAGR